MHNCHSFIDLLLCDNLFHILHYLVLPLPALTFEYLDCCFYLWLSILYVTFDMMVLTLKVTLVVCEFHDC